MLGIRMGVGGTQGTADLRGGPSPAHRKLVDIRTMQVLPSRQNHKGHPWRGSGRLPPQVICCPWAQPPCRSKPRTWWWPRHTAGQQHQQSRG